MRMVEEWKVKESKRVFDNKWLSVRRDDLITGRGKELDWYIAEVKDAVAVVGITPEGKMILIKQFRPGANEVLTQLPAGLHDWKDEEESARKEFTQETGYEAREWKKLGKCNSLDGICTQKITYFLALNAVKKGMQELDDGEDIEVMEVEAKKALEMIKKGEIRSQYTITGITLAYLNKPELFE